MSGKDRCYILCNYFLIDQRRGAAGATAKGLTKIFAMTFAFVVIGSQDRLLRGTTFHIIVAGHATQCDHVNAEKEEEYFHRCKDKENACGAAKRTKK